MLRIEAVTLEDAYKDAASSLNCSVTELYIEVMQYPRNGVLGVFKRNAIIVAEKLTEDELKSVPKQTLKIKEKEDTEKKESFGNKKLKKLKNIFKKEKVEKIEEKEDVVVEVSEKLVTEVEDSIPVEEPEHISEYIDEVEDKQEESELSKIADEIKKDINELFNLICFEIDDIEVSAYDENTLLIEFRGNDSALLIGKEGYRYKALSYMLFNWINAKYKVGLRLEIAEFLQNQEEAVTRYLLSVYEIIDKEGRAQTKILDGVLIQIALTELRERYPDKYVVIRSTRDGHKYIIVNDYHS